MFKFVERNFSLPSFLVKYAGYKQHGLFLRYYSDSKEKKEMGAKSEGRYTKLLSRVHCYSHSFLSY
jgi:hypothetical protein